MDEKILYRPRELAKLLACSRSKAYVLLQSGEIPRVRLGKRGIRVSIDDVRAWVKRQTEGGQPDE